MKELFAVRNAARTALRAHLEGAPLHTIEESKHHLNAAYGRFVFRFRPLNAPANAAAMGSDADAFFLRVRRGRPWSIGIGRYAEP